MSGKSDTLHGVDFTRRSQGGKVRPRTLLSERSKLRATFFYPTLRSVTEDLVAISGLQMNSSQKAKIGTYVLLAINAMQANRSGIARGEKASQGH
jgi:hypothetical protein